MVTKKNRGCIKRLQGRRCGAPAVADSPSLMHFMPFTHNQKVSCIIFRTLLRRTDDDDAIGFHARRSISSQNDKAST